MRSFTQSFLILSCLVLAACSSNDKRPEDLSEREFYEQAREAMADNNFLIASERLQQLESRYPFGDYAEQAQLELIYTQHMMGDMEVLLSAIPPQNKHVVTRPLFVMRLIILMS